ncbi:MAG: Hsp70 family protein, partial [Myxococcales bacterium]|nr:Hsp70 family protein [Myxococcales bacterium]
DYRLINHLHQNFVREWGLELVRDKMALQRLKEAAEKAKCDLSSTDETAVELPFIAADDEGPKHLSQVLTREELEHLTGDLVERTIATCGVALKDAGLNARDIDMVLLVGGQTRMPLVKDRVTEFFGREPSEIMNPDEVVACGAAIQGGVMHGEVADVLLLDVTPLSLGVETQGGMFTKIIDRNTNIPCTAGQIFSTTVDNQSLVSVHVLQGERPLAADNHSLARFDLIGLPPAPRGVPQVEVAFNIDNNGLVSVTATELGTGKQQTVRVTANGGLTEREIENMIIEAEERAQDDSSRRALVDLRNRAKGLIYTTERSIAEYAEFLDPAALDQLQADLDYCSELITNEHVGFQDLQTAMNQLEEGAHALADILYSQMAYDDEPYPDE